VLNQKSELQRAYDKQKERHAAAEQHSPDAEIIGGIPGLKGELGRVIMERAQKQEAAQKQDQEDAEDRQYVNPEYLNVRAKLRQAQPTNH